VDRYWVPTDGVDGNLCYFVHCRSAEQELHGHGVLRDQVVRSGHPLPHGLVGGEDLSAARGCLAARLWRLDHGGDFVREVAGALEGEIAGSGPEGRARPPLLTAIVAEESDGDDGARRLLRELAPVLEGGQVRLALVDGRLPQVADATALEILADEAGLSSLPRWSLSIHTPDDAVDLQRQVTRLLGQTDILRCAPDEHVFAAGLGIPLLLTRPRTRTQKDLHGWARRRGVARTVEGAIPLGELIDQWLGDGTLAEMAWRGYRSVSKRGLYRIERSLGVSSSP
jgi:hypothetical protein